MGRSPSCSFACESRTIALLLLQGMFFLIHPIACSAPEMVIPQDGSSADVSMDPDSMESGGSPTDGSSVSDAMGTPDAPRPVSDGTAADTTGPGMDATMIADDRGAWMDTVSPFDVSRTDGAPSGDGFGPSEASTVDAARDVTLDAMADAALSPDAVCAGPFTVMVTAPTANQEIETCTRGGMPVYFEFVAVAVGASSVEFAFRTPTGSLAAPALPPDTVPPFSVRRQVGGPMTDMVALATFGLRGTWHVEVTARDACGRTATARQPFSLVYSNRMCSNP